MDIVTSFWTRIFVGLNLNIAVGINRFWELFCFCKVIRVQSWKIACMPSSSTIYNFWKCIQINLFHPKFFFRHEHALFDNIFSKRKRKKFAKPFSGSYGGPRRVFDPIKGRKSRDTGPLRKKTRFPNVDLPSPVFCHLKRHIFKHSQKAHLNIFFAVQDIHLSMYMTHKQQILTHYVRVD